MFSNCYLSIIETTTLSLLNKTKTCFDLTKLALNDIGRGKFVCAQTYQ